jgi:uncharacterized protein YeeX (DUF496 family)
MKMVENCIKTDPKAFIDKIDDDEIDNVNLSKAIIAIEQTLKQSCSSANVQQ